METEIWKDIIWYEWLYQVSNLWNIKSFSNKKTNILKSWYCKWYYQIHLHNDWIKNRILVHRLVAQAFIPNPENKPQVNHKDWNKQNNCVQNLEWVTRSENAIHSYRILWNKSKWWSYWKFWKDNPLSKKVNQYDLDWTFIKTWDCMSEISSILKINRIGILHCCKNRSNKSWWFIWRYNLI